MELIPMTIRSKYFINMLNLYTLLYGADPLEMQQQFQRHFQYPNFEGYFAVIDKRLAGFIYGYSSCKGQYYHELLSKHLNGDRNWTENCMELAELGVHPQYRRRGIAKELVEALLKNRTESKALLTTRKDNSAGVHFYRKMRWTEVSDGFFPNVPYEYIIFGKDLSPSV
ncbi:GNAT family N-acetyltransferase [Bacillus sp. P14.5]|uniref:GNAT family N-acetyltransferase n=1 Tax=Bacillus sp. P14.5 TaxID=1983400 RepID=UPI000DEA6B7A|nr:GNAT family N-acetyltransferase [Bacillus sp. P14.5]